MNTTLNRSIIILIALVVSTLVLSVTTGMPHKPVRVGIAAMCQQQPGPVPSGNNYSEVLNGLFNAGGR